MIFAKPSSEQEAVSLLSNSNGISRILGGGTDVLVQMRSGIIEPDLIVDIKNIKIHINLNKSINDNLSINIHIIYFFP